MKTVAMTKEKKLTIRNGAPVVDNQKTTTAGPRGPVLLQAAPRTL
jgi:catalase